jgi:hypothetical protein
MVLARLADPQARRRVLADWADPRWLALFQSGGPGAVAAEVERVLGREARPGPDGGSSRLARDETGDP